VCLGLHHEPIKLFASGVTLIGVLEVAVKGALTVIFAVKMIAYNLASVGVYFLSFAYLST
jgi:hypothetical protein